MTALLEVRAVTKVFGGVVANHELTLAVEDGSITGLIGPNGSGKTTLFNSIVGYHPIDAGSITFDGREISRLRVPTSRGSACYARFSRPAFTAR
jgi:branched-chain amino acid transport system ATP-binding protein